MSIKIINYFDYLPDVEMEDIYYALKDVRENPEIKILSTFTPDGEKPFSQVIILYTADGDCTVSEVEDAWLSWRKTMTDLEDAMNKEVQ